VRRILAVDGAVAGFSAARLGDGVETARRIDGMRALEEGLAVIDGLLAAAGWRVADLDGIAVGTGPGGFSGLRIAVSYAKGLALARGLPLAGVSSYDAVEPAGTAPPAVAAVSGRAGLACARLRLPGTDPPLVVCGTHEQVAHALDRALDGFQGREIACSGIVEGVAERLGERGYIVRAHALLDQPAALAIAKVAARSPHPFGAAHAVRPDYGV
jgi:tRNA threonylcarbamoyladenosine biosynthesis protein TsaB